MSELKWDACPKCENTVDVDKETLDGSEVRCLGCRSWLTVSIDGDGGISLYDNTVDDEAEEGLKVIDVYGDGADVVIARDEEDARAIMPGADFDAAAFKVYPDDAPFTMFVDESRLPVTKTCAEWVAEFGRGYLCTNCQ